MPSSAGGGVKGPFKTGANEVAGVGAVLVGAGAEYAVRITESAGGGALILARGPRRCKHWSTEPRRAKWLEPQSPPALGVSL